MGRSWHRPLALAIHASLPRSADAGSVAWLRSHEPRIIVVCAGDAVDCAVEVAGVPGRPAPVLTAPLGAPVCSRRRRSTIWPSWREHASGPRVPRATSSSCRPARVPSACQLRDELRDVVVGAPGGGAQELRPVAPIAACESPRCTLASALLCRDPIPASRWIDNRAAGDGPLSMARTQIDREE
jgi:hypothetical protein